MANFIVVGILVAAVGMAISYIVKAKKSGTKCIGCPSGGCCQGAKNNGHSCSCHQNEK